MTKDEAAAAITSALASAGHIEGVLSADAFASRLATALEALHLLDHCALTIAPPVPGDPLGRAAAQEAERMQRSIAAHATLREADVAAGRTTATEQWATSRERS